MIKASFYRKEKVLCFVSLRYWRKKPESPESACEAFELALESASTDFFAGLSTSSLGWATQIPLVSFYNFG